MEFFRAVPLLLLIIFIWALAGYPLYTIWPLVAGLVLYNGSVLAEIFRAGINAVPSGQVEAGYALGLRKTAVTRIIQLPQAIRIMIPSLISQCIVALKDTSLGYVITASGLTVAGREIWRTFGNYLATALVLAAIYILLNLLLSWFGNWIEDASTAPPRSPTATRLGPHGPGAAPPRQRQHRRWSDLFGTSTTTRAPAPMVPGPSCVRGQDLGVTQRWIVPSTTTVPSARVARTVTGTSGACAQSPASSWPCRSDRSWTWPGTSRPCPWGATAESSGTVGLCEQAHGASRPLQTAMAWDGADVVVHGLALGSSSSARCGSTERTRILMVRKYGALRPNSVEKSQSPFGSAVMRRYMS